MPKSKDTFNNKFLLLCSQESHHEINWSSTDSSDYENVSNIDKHVTFNKKNRKRKRKQKGLKNISNLDIKVAEVTNSKDMSRIKERDETSSLLSQHHPPYKITSAHTSPIICLKTMKTEGISKSPILVLKTASLLYSPKVKKKLFAHYNDDKINIKTKSSADYDAESKIDTTSSVNVETCDQEYLNNDVELNKNDDGSTSESSITKENKSTIQLDDSLDSLKSTKDWKLANRVKSFFDSNFSSESPSQISIQDSLTPKSNSISSAKSSDHIDIVNSQTNSNRTSSESSKEEPDLILQSKPIRYNKNGLAFRLNVMLKKHNASISLWQHERFLAANSNFLIPKGKHLIFVIRNIEFKYGCFLLHARNVENEPFLILINNDYVNNCNIYKDMILKVYEPFKILELNTHKCLKLVINVCKFQVEKIND